MSNSEDKSLQQQQQKKKIAHDLEELPEGEEIIMTLQDQAILEKNSEVNEKIDVLENAQLMDKAKAEFNQFMKQNIKKLASQAQSHIDLKMTGNENDPSSKILPHYNEIKFEKKGIILDGEGKFVLDKQTQLQMIKDKLKGVSKEDVSIGESEQVIAQEYE